MKKNMQASEIIDLIENHAEIHGLLRKRQIGRQATNQAIIKALQLTENPHTREILCNILGAKRAKTALASLIVCLDDQSSGVRSEAADSLGQLKDFRAGQPLMQRFQIESDTEVQAMIAAALGGVVYKPAIPLLIGLLASEDATLRGCAAWSLGVLNASEALDLLQQLAITETESYAKEQIRVAVERIKNVT